MKKYLPLIVFALLATSVSLFAQESPVGVWKTVDDNSGEARSHVEIYEKDGKFYGKIIKLLEDSEVSLCERCPGEKKNQPLIGLEIMWDLKKHKDYWSSGRIMDPENGKTYKCNIRLDGNDKLKVRGYIGFAALGRTQVWYRL